MYSNRYSLLVAILVVFALMIGCSGGGPVTPENSTDTSNVPIIDLASYGDVFSAIGLLGAYEVVVNENMTAELTAKRYSSIGEGYIVSGAGFFTVAPCGNCLMLVGVEIDGTNVILTFKVKHPFDPGDPAKPPTAMNRNDLNTFDLAAEILFPEIEPDTTFETTDIFSGSVVNATGYTKELVNVTGIDVALPYIMVIDDDVLEQNTWNEFSMGAEEFFDVILDPSGGPISFDMYLTMGYGASAKKMQRLTPKYFNPEFNRCAAWKMEIIPPEGEDPPSQENTWKDDDSTTEWPITIKLWDWQYNATVWDGIDPATFEETDGTMIVAPSDPETVEIEIVDLALVSVSPITVSSGSGMPGDPLIIEVGVANDQMAAAGTYPGLVKVIDSRPAGESLVGGEPDTGVDSPDGVALNWFQFTDYSVYGLFTATVVPSCGPISGQIDSPTCPVSGIGDGATLAFDVSASSANGGDPIMQYEVDFNYDGVTFTPDDSNATGVFPAVGPFDIPDPCEDNIPMEFTVAFRATDSCDIPNVSIFATCEVTVDICCSDQTLEYNWDSCGYGATSCENWQCGGCGLPNNDGYSWGRFKFGCNASGANGCTDITPSYLTTGGDSSGCSYLTDHWTSANFNVVSPSINLPSAADGVIHFDTCNAFASGATARLYISEADCSGPWTEIWSTTTASGCHQDITADISTYSSASTMFRFQYQSSQYTWSGGACGNAGIVIDNVTIEGCFGGTLEEN